MPNNQPEIVIFQKLEHTLPSELRYFKALELKDPRTTPLDNGEPEEKPRPHEHTTTRHRRNSGAS
jgi:hypothetical protein